MRKLKITLVFYCLCNTALLAIPNIDVGTAALPDSLKEKFNNAPSEEKKVDALNDISYYLSNRNPELAESFARDAMQIADSKGYKFGLMESNNIVGIAFYRLSKFQQSLTCFFQALELATELDMQNKKAAICNNISLVYISLSEYEKALSFNNMALDIYIGYNDTTGIAKAYNNIGMTYHSKGDYVTARLYYKKAIVIKEKQRDKDAISNSNNNIGQLFFEMYTDTSGWALDSALYYFIKAYAGFNATSNKVGLAQVLPNIANIYSEKKADEKALDAYRAALNAQKEVGDSASLGTTYYNMGLLYHQNKEEEMAMNHFLKSLNIAEQLSLAELKRDILEQLFFMHLKKGDEKKANSYAAIIIQINDSLNEMAHNELLLSYSGKFEFQKFENLKLKETESFHRKWLIISFLFGGLMVLVLVTLIIIRVKKKI